MATKKKKPLVTVAVAQDDTEEIGRVLAGLVACGILAAASDGEIEQDETNTILAILVTFVHGAGIEATEREVAEIADGIEHNLAEKGTAAVLKGLPLVLTSREERRLGVMTAAAVMASDGNVDHDEESAYYTIAKSLGFDRAEADELWHEALAHDEG